MASWQGEHRQRRSALPGPMDPVGSPRASQALPQAGRVWVQTPLCRDAAQVDAALHMLGRNHVYAKRYKQLLQSRTHPCLWVLLGDKTALASYYEADLILRQRATEISSLGSLELGLGTQQLPRGAVCTRSLVQPCRELRDTTRLRGMAAE